MDEIHRDIQPLIGRGAMPDYIPPSGQGLRKKIGMTLQTIDGQSCEIGDAGARFSIQSISRRFFDAGLSTVWNVTLEEGGQGTFRLTI